MRRRLDVLLFAVLVALKANANLQTIDWGADGGYYADIARNFATSGQLASSISMYHEGFVAFPTPTPVYPLWPLVLGVVARALPLEVAAVWLPTALYFGAVLAAGWLGRRLWPRPVWPELGIDAGHVAAATLALEPRFFEYTSRPYTEGLAMLLLGLALHRAVDRLRTPGLAGGLELGVWSAALLCVRGPWVPVVGAFFVGTLLPLLARRAPGRFALPAGFLAGFGLGMVPLVVWFGQVPGAELVHLVRFDAWRVTEGLSTADLLVPAAGAWDWAVDRGAGVVLSLNAPDKRSWYPNFGLLLFAPLAALLVSGRSLAAGAWGWLRDPERRGALLTVGVGLATAIALHGVHKLQGAEWNFSTRHAVAALPLFVGATLWLLEQGGWLRAGATFLLCATLGYDLVECSAARTELRLGPVELRRWQAAGAWVAEHVPADQTVAYTSCQVLVRFAPGRGCVEVHDYTTPDDLRWMIAHEQVGAVLLDASDRGNGDLRGGDALPDWDALPSPPPGFLAFTPRSP